MKIGILTHPLINNYGGILQAWSLTTILKNQGHSCIVLDYRVRPPFFKRIVITILNFFFYIRNVNLKRRSLVLEKYINDNINRTNKIYTASSIRKVIESENIDAIIVGSDQVWRRNFALSRGLGTYFLSFISPEDGIRKVAYAASFAKSEWEYDEEETMLLKKWLSQFKAVSVREFSGVNLCKNKLSVKAEHTLDPTLLMDTIAFDKILTNRMVEEKYAFIYWLGDENDLKKEIEKYEISNIRKVVVSHSSPDILSVQQWLSAIRYADVILTDSFHGCVFSIIFKRHFIISKNDDGGNDRLISLFMMLGMESKLVNPQSTENYDIINERINSLRKQSLKFLVNALN